MGYFTDLLKARNYTKCPLPLWRLKVTDKEYEDLKGLLSQHARMYRTFMNVRYEATLFFAEYWRREYSEGVHSKEMVFAAISDRYDKRLVDNFFLEAKKGAELLGIEKYVGERNEYLNSMLYQGGLPMKLVTTTDVNSTWGRFVKGLVFRNVNFDDLNLGIVASNHMGLRQYCSQLCDAVDSKDFTRMPCWCENEQNPWYQFLLNKFTSVKRSHRLANPFTLDWEFSFDKVDGLIHIKYDFKGLQRLPKVFCEENHLAVGKFISLNVTRNGQSVDSFDYLDGFCRHDVRSKHPYREGDVITAYIQGIDNPLIKESLDLSTPHLLALSDKGRYKPSNRIGRVESVILVPEDWEVITSDGDFQITEMRWVDTTFKCIWLPDNFSSEVILSGDDGRLVFGADTCMSWTEISSLPLPYSNVIEPLYNASKLSCLQCSEGEEVTMKKKASVLEFRNKWSDKWSTVPSYGEIFVRPRSLDGDFVAHEKIINIGDSLSIDTVEADSTHCKIRIDWPYGHVVGPETAIVNDCEWLIERNQEVEVNKNHIGFSFIPFHNERSCFTIHVRAPFKDFSITDSEGNKLNNGCFVPYSDVDKYSYYIVGMDVKKLKVGDVEYRLKWAEDQLYMLLDESNSVPIPYEGSLTRILGSREDLRAMLDKTSNDMLHAEIPVSFELANGNIFNFKIKEAPFLVRQVGESIYVIEKEWPPLNYKRALKLLKLDNPSIPPVTIKPNEDGYFTLPEEVKDWGKTLVIGRNRGRICPALVDTQTVLSPEDRRQNKCETIARIHEELDTATIASPVWKRIIGWFDRCNSEDIPASSLLDLSCLKDDPNFLLKFALLKYAETSEEDRENLDDRLLEMAKDLAFQWYWILPRVNGGLVSLIQAFITEDCWKSEFVTKLFVSRISRKDPENLMAHLADMATGNENFVMTLLNDCLIPLMSEFHAWLTALCEKSLRRPFKDTMIDANSSTIITYIVNHKKLIEVELDRYEEVIISLNQELDEYTQAYFSQFKVPGNKSINETWLLQRVKCVAEQIRGNIDLFSQSGSVRRSIIYCYRAITQQFLLELNNELAK